MTSRFAMAASVLIATTLQLSGCRDDVPPTEAPSSDTSTSDTGFTDTTGHQPADSSSGSLDDTGSGEGSATGGSEDDEPGQTNTQLVSAGTRASSSIYTVVFTFGQPSAHQGTHITAKYQLQGGLIGANGRPPR